MHAPALTTLLCSHTSELGGAELMLETMVRGLRDHGIAPHVATPGPGPLHERLATLGVPIHTLPFGAIKRIRRTSSLGSAVAALPSVAHVARATNRLARSIQAQVVLTNSQKAHVACSLGAAAARVRVIWRMHDIVTPDTFGAAERHALRIASLLSRPRVLAVSKAAADATLRNLGLTNVAVVYNGIDETRTAPKAPFDLRRACGWPSDAEVIGMLGRLVPWKGGGDFIGAARLIAESCPSSRFVMVGDPIHDSARKFQDEIGQQIRDAGLTARLRVMPFQEDVAAVLANYDILVQPSLEPDPLPLAVIEALAAGVPVVGFAHGGVTELVTDGVSGRLIPVGDVPGLAEACTELVRHPGDRLRYSNAARKAAQPFTAGVMCAAIAREIAACAEGRRGSGTLLIPDHPTRSEDVWGGPWRES